MRRYVGNVRLVLCNAKEVPKRIWQSIALTKIVHNPKQIFLGITVIFLGLLVYFIDRPPYQTAWFSDHFSLYHVTPQILGRLGDNLPSFVHVLGLSMITAGIIVQKKWAYVIICGSWLFLNLLFELLQTDAAYTWLNYMSINHDKLNPILQWFKNYSLHAVFDPKDVFALISGAILAYIILIKTKKGA